MVNDSNYFYNHSRGILIYLIDKKENKKFAFYKNFPQLYEISDDHEQYAFKTYNQEDKQIDTIQTGLPMDILQIILMECDLKSPTTIPNYKLFSEDEKNEMRKYNGPLLEDEDCGGEEIELNEIDELPVGEIHANHANYLLPILPRIRQIARRPTRLLPIIDSPLAYEREELEQQIIEHLIKESND